MPQPDEPGHAGADQQERHRLGHGGRRPVRPVQLDPGLVALAVAGALEADQLAVESVGFVYTSARNREHELSRLPYGDAADWATAGAGEGGVEVPAERNDIGPMAEGRRLNVAFEDRVEVRIGRAEERGGDACGEVEGIGDDVAGVRGRARVGQADRRP